MKKTCFFILGIIFLQIAYAQQNFQPGYIIPVGKDTLHGYIDYKNWEWNPRKISFKKMLDDETIWFLPTDINSFSVQGEIYISAQVDIEVSPFKTNQIEENKELNIISEHVFLQTIYEGRKSLYFYVNTYGNENFYIRHDTAIELLIHKKYLINQDGHRSISENNRFLGQLIVYLSDCPSIQPKIKETEYTLQGLSKLFNEYLECTDERTTFQARKEKIVTEMGILAGLSSRTLKFRSNDFDYLVNAGFNHSNNLTFGLFLNIIKPRNHEQWSLNNELMITSYSVEGEFMDFKNENKYTLTSTKIGFTYMKLNNMIRYSYPLGKASVWIDAGISNAIPLTETNEKIIFSKFYETERTNTGHALESIRKLEMGLLIGLGVRFHDFSFVTRYERGSGVSSFYNLASRTTGFHFLLGYCF
jgi:hypothetical protein